METITNAASAITSTASNLIYGQPAKENETNNTTTTTGNETGGKEPLSGEQGKGTIAEPFDQGNKDTPLATPSATGTTSYQQEDFLKLNPTAAPMTGNTDTTSSSATGVTDKATVGDHEWKPTAIDEVKPEGAPGAGPAPPANVTVATPDLSSTTPKKVEEPTTAKDTNEKNTTEKDTTEKNTTSSSSGEASASKKEPSGPHSVGSDIDKILESQPKSQHTVNDSEASDPHSKMTGTTVRQTEASQHGESGNSKSLATEKTGNSSASHGSDEAGDEKVKLSTKDKIKAKLHIGHKDK